MLVSSWFSLHVGDWWRLRRRSNIYRKVAGLASLESGESTVYNFGAEITDVETSHALLTIQKQYLNQRLN